MTNDRHIERITLSNTMGSSAAIEKKESPLAADLQGFHDSLLNKNAVMRRMGTIDPSLIKHMQTNRCLCVHF